jgi:hypothetical protein
MKSAPNKRRGLRRLECECGAAVYATWSQLERHGRPVCACGGSFLPDDVELAFALGLEEAPVLVEYRAALSSVMHGQAPAGRAMRNSGRELRDPSVIAAARVERSRRDRARSNRLGALAPVADSMPF